MDHPLDIGIVKARTECGCRNYCCLEFISHSWISVAFCSYLPDSDVYTGQPNISPSIQASS
jgi:hypothetical protein